MTRRPFLFFSAATLAASLMLSGCSVVNINGTHRTDDNVLCVVPPEWDNDEIRKPLLELLTKKHFVVTVLAPGTAPSACRQTLVYAWRREQYWLPAVVKQYGIDMNLYVDGEYRANASFEPTRNLLSPHVKYIRFTRYLARVLDRFFPGRPQVGA